MKVHILVRTSNRPNAFRRCIHSIENQRYKDVQIIVGNDNNDDYCKSYNPVKFERDNSYDWQHMACIDTARYFPFNAYLNKMMARIQDQGWVIILDDDDIFVDKTALQTIMDYLKSDTQMAFWRADVHGNIIPTDDAWGKRPQKRNTSMIGFCFNAKYIPLLHVAPWKQADWRLADQLYSLCEPVWINKVLTKTQSYTEGRGNREDV